jgi:esterase/lipase
MLFRLVLTGLVAVLAAGCSVPGKRFERIPEYQMTKFDSAESYRQYQTRVATELEKNWKALAQSPDDAPQYSEAVIKKLVAAHTPTDMKPADPGRCKNKTRNMLLIHGLYDSPRVMRDLEAYFNSRCFHTRSILLPGHGTRPGSLLNISYKAWVDAVNYAVERFHKEIDGDLYITGFSTGGALALKTALDKPGEVKGLFLFAPAIKVADGMPRFLRGIGMEWVLFQKLKDTDLIKYESMTLDSVLEVGKLADKVREKLSDNSRHLNIPVMLVIAKNDYTIKTETTINLYEQGKFGDKSDMLIYAPIKVNGKQCIKGMRRGNPQATPKVPTYVSSCFIHEQNGKKFVIADYSHMALTLKPTDKHYGLEGEYKYCTQYFYDEEMENKCKQKGTAGVAICFGERKMMDSVCYPQCAKRHMIVRRLTSNPQFKELTGYLDQFISNNID